MSSSRFKQTRRLIIGRAVLPPFVLAIVLCGTLVYYFATYSQDQVESRLARVVADHRRLIDQFLAERVSDLKFAAASYSLADLRRQARLSELLGRLRSGSKAFFDLGVFDDAGNHLAYVGPFDLVGKNYAETEWFQAVRGKGLYISDVFLGYRNIPHFILAVRWEEDGRCGYLRATIDTGYFNDLVESIRIGKTGEAYLVNRHGVLQTKRRVEGDLMQTDPDYGRYRIDEEAVTSFSVAGPSRRHLCATGVLRQIGWVLVVKQEAGDAYGMLTRAVLVAVAVVVAGGIVLVLLAFVLASVLARQLTAADREKREMKTQLIMAGKLAEVGEMSAGLAHEINNPLQVMKSEQTMIEDALGDLERGEPPPDAECLRMIRDGASQIALQIDRCSRITRELLNFSRKRAPSLETVRLQELLPALVGMVESRARTQNVQIVQEIAPDLAPLMSDPGQLQQVFLNLLNNAIHALRGKDGGHIRISAVQEGSAVAVVSVSDDGCGIAPENMEKIFLPFFTTKPPGQGTGLGLSTAGTIVEGLGGEVSVTSELHAGTVFTVRLPLASGEETTDAEQERQPDELSRREAGHHGQHTGAFGG